MPASLDLEGATWLQIVRVLNWPPFVYGFVLCIGAHKLCDVYGPSMRWPFNKECASHATLPPLRSAPARRLTPPSRPPTHPLLLRRRSITGTSVNGMPYFSSGTIPYSGMVLFTIIVWSLLVVVGEQLYTSPAVSLRRRTVAGLQLTLGFGEAMFFTNFWTELGKNWVGEIRPDFQGRCTDPDSGVLDTVCAKGRLSFPSGHASMAVCMGTWMTLYLCWGQYVRDVRVQGVGAAPTGGCGCGRLLPRLRRLLPRLDSCSNLFHTVPTILGLWVCASRVAHFRHRPGDVCAGALLGALVASVTFLRTATSTTALIDATASQEALAAGGGVAQQGGSNTEMQLSALGGSKRFDQENPSTDTNPRGTSTA